MSADAKFEAHPASSTHSYLKEIHPRNGKRGIADKLQFLGKKSYPILSKTQGFSCSNQHWLPRMFFIVKRRIFGTTEVVPLKSCPDTNLTASYRQSAPGTRNTSGLKQLELSPKCRNSRARLQP